MRVMREYKFFQFLLIFGTSLSLFGIFLFVRDKMQTNSAPLHQSTGLLTSNTYFGPTAPVPGNPLLIKVEILIRDSPELGGLTIQSAEFNGQSIPLKPRDIFGNRGTGSFQVAPGTYTLQWVVQKDKIAWPRTITHEEQVTIDPRDQWVQVSIEGEKASIL